MKKLLLCLIVVLAIAAFPLVANATVQTYEFSFTAQNMLSYQTANGADGSTAVQNSLFDGARLKRNGSSPGLGSSRSYVASENVGFQSWADNTTDKFLDFNLWGLDGNGAKWGDDFKPTAWGSTTSTSGWTSSTYTWPSAWGLPPAGYITDEFIGWSADSYSDGFNFQDNNLNDKAFTFQVDIDSSNAFWGKDTNGAPNDLSKPELTFWFGGWFDDDLWGDEENYYMYEGNMVLTGREVAPVPEPSTILLLGSGLLGLGWYGRKRKKA